MLQVVCYRKVHHMELFPQFGLGWLNGWILLVVFVAVFGAVLRALPKGVVTKLYDRSGWTSQQRTVTRIGKVVALVCTVLFVVVPLKVGHGVFWVGLAVFALGLVGLVVALIDYSHMSPGEPATKGLYRISRNPQWVALVVLYLGISLAVGSWLQVLLLVILAALYHVRILAEERSCIQLYGESYRRYMDQVPRYLVFF
jgi:protein-S-isoprenylcysteine O-methyltransferase Ste14